MGVLKNCVMDYLICTNRVKASTKIITENFRRSNENCFLILCLGNVTAPLVIIWLLLIIDDEKIYRNHQIKIKSSKKW